jgi:hypothetical protein
MIDYTTLLGRDSLNRLVAGISLSLQKTKTFEKSRLSRTSGVRNLDAG